MKKIWLTLVAALCCTATLTADPVSPSVARQVAAQFLRAQGATLAGDVANSQPRRSVAAFNDAPAYYVFNADAAQGFVVVSGDDCVGDNLVLGYSMQGSFSADDVPENLQWWLDATAEGIAWLRSLGVRAMSVPLHADIAPMTTTKWNQLYPYNTSCPTVDGQLCVTGCMATALAQVMRYHRWPQSATGTLPAYSLSSGDIVDALPSTTFDWDNMQDEYHDDSTDEQKGAVATLMRYCGQSVQMNYSPQSSNGRCHFLDVLVNSFDYDPSLYNAHANEYSVNGWDALIYNELHDGRPLVYAGYSTGGGHAFVIDGYEVKDGEGYYHVNWGWSGNSDGFYKISLLNANGSGSGASSTPDGYSVRQDALINLMPRTDSSEPFYRGLSSFEWNFMTKNGPRFSMVNQSWEAGSFTYALVGRNSDGSPDFSQIYADQAIDILPGFTTASYFQGKLDGILRVTLSEDLGHAIFDDCDPGRHDFMFVSQENIEGAPAYSVFGPDAYIEVNIGDDRKFKNFVVHPCPELTSSADIRVEGLMQRGILDVLTATISNSGDSYIGTVACYLCALKDGMLSEPYVMFRTGIMVEPDTSSEVCFPLSAPQAGEFVVVVMSVENYLPIGIPLADIAQLPNYLCHKMVTFDELAFVCDGVNYVEQTGEEPVYQLDIALDNGTPLDYDAFLMVNLFRRNISGEWEPVTMPDQPMIYCPLRLAAGEKTTASMKLSEALPMGDYLAKMFIANDFHSNVASDYFIFTTMPLTVTNTDMSGVESLKFGVERDGQSDIWYDLVGRRLNEKPTQKGVYLRNRQKVLVE